MFKRLIPSIFCAVAISAVVAVPAYAADDIETRVQVCSACHGPNGEPTSATTPIIWGQQANYLYKELHDYHSGDRTNAIMTSMAQGFTLPNLRLVANYFAAKTWPARRAASASATPPEGTAVCQACHGKNFEGGAPAPTTGRAQLRIFDRRNERLCRS